MFRAKICGVRLEDDVRAVGRSGGDAIGLNFFPKSVRYVDPQSESTGQLSAVAADEGLLRVGVFVNDSADQIRRVVDGVGLDAVQLHGDEPDSLVEALSRRGYRVIRAVKLPRGAIDPSVIEVRCRRYADAGCHLLLDVDAGAAHGGSGRTLDWDSVADWAGGRAATAWTLAGGLTPENVAEAIRRTGAASVDTASGVEKDRGVKDPDRIGRFLDQAMGRSAE